MIENSPERKAFEEWYACNAFDYVAHPIGSRECGLQWRAWYARAALAAPVVPDTQAQELQRLRSLLTEARGHLQGRKMSMLAMSQTRLLQAIDHALQPKEQTC